jgi:YD repeat-containing protein
MPSWVPQVTDPNGKVTPTYYALGRIIAVWLPGGGPTRVK